MIQAGDRVLALLDMLVVKGTATTMFGTQDLIEGRNVWKIPLDDATVERLARAAYLSTHESREVPILWDDLVEWMRERYRQVARAVIAALIGDAATSAGGEGGEG